MTLLSGRCLVVLSVDVEILFVCIVQWLSKDVATGVL
jgi:hypothetical protein